MRKFIRVSILILIMGVPAFGQTLMVRHDHDPWGACKGELEITAEGIEFRSGKEEHSRKWQWIDIQSFDRKSDQRFSILTWEDQKWKLGLDRYYDFTILPGEEGLSEETFRLIRHNLNGTVTDRIPAPEAKFDYIIPVKHLHTFGGCEGRLMLGPDWIVYQTDEPRHSRTWRRPKDVESIWSSNRYQLEVHVFEENQREFDKTKRYRFQLKEPLSLAYYEQIRREEIAFW